MAQSIRFWRDEDHDPHTRLTDPDEDPNLVILKGFFDEFFGGVGVAKKNNRLDFDGNPGTIWIQEFLKDSLFMVLLQFL